MNDHDGSRVVPGRYAGEAIRLHDGPTPQAVAYAEERSHADALAGKICAAAADAARAQYISLELLGQFDAVGGIKHWSDFKSLAHWLCWVCAMTPGVAREYVRVANALRRMPMVAGLFREGRLSYSKVREVTRVVDVVDEAKLCQLAVTATASQLAPYGLWVPGCRWAADQPAGPCGDVEQVAAPGVGSTATPTPCWM